MPDPTSRSDGDCQTLTIGCTPLINRVRRHLASQCLEIDNLDALPCLSKCPKNVENGVDALVFFLC